LISGKQYMRWLMHAF